MPSRCQQGQTISGTCNTAGKPYRFLVSTHDYYFLGAYGKQPEPDIRPDTGQNCLMTKSKPFMTGLISTSYIYSCTCRTSQ